MWNIAGICIVNSVIPLALSCTHNGTPWNPSSNKGANFEREKKNERNHGQNFANVPLCQRRVDGNGGKRNVSTYVISDLQNRERLTHSCVFLKYFHSCISQESEWGLGITSSDRVACRLSRLGIKWSYITVLTARELGWISNSRPSRRLTCVIWIISLKPRIAAAYLRVMRAG